MKNILLLTTLSISSLIFGQNALLEGATTGEITAPTYDIEFVYDGSDLVLVTGSYNTGYLYAIDFNHTTADGVLDWETNDIPDILSTIAGLLGTTEENISIWDMKVNPKTNAVVLLVFDSDATNTFLFEAKNPTDIALISLDDVTYSRVKYTLDENFLHDIEWSQDEEKVYFSQGDFLLDASVGYVELPFVHNATATIHATSVFKSNWGGGYFTEAPLERLSVTRVNGENRLMGVTTCAPGFSIPTATVNEATELIEVTEDFNVLFSSPLKTVAVTQVSGTGTASYLFDLHERGSNTQIIRIGEKYLTGTVTDTNNTSDLLRTASGAINASLDENEAKEIALGYEMIAFYSDYALMVVDDNDVLRLMDITSSNLSTKEPQLTTLIQLSPNPSSDFITIRSSNNQSALTDASYSIYDSSGKLINVGEIPDSGKISIERLERGNYIVIVHNSNTVLAKNNFVKS